MLKMARCILFFVLVEKIQRFAVPGTMRKMCKYFDFNVFRKATIPSGDSCAIVCVYFSHKHHTKEN